MPFSMFAALGALLGFSFSWCVINVAKLPPDSRGYWILVGLYFATVVTTALAMRNT